MKAAIYARVSTDQQNPEMQLREVRDYCRRRGLEIAGEYVDKGISGIKERRPELDRLLAACRKRRVDVVVVYRYDRFARSLRQLVNALEEFRSLGIDFVSLHEESTLAPLMADSWFGIFASIAEFERELIRERVRSGVAAAKAKGKPVGRRATVNVSHARVLLASGHSMAQVGSAMGVSAATVCRRLQGYANGRGTHTPATRVPSWRPVTVWPRWGRHAVPRRCANQFAYTLATYALPTSVCQPQARPELVHFRHKKVHIIVVLT